MSSFNPNITDEELEGWRQVQDDEADAVAAALMDSPLGHVIYPVLSQIEKNSDEVSVDMFNRVHPEEANNAEYERLAGILTDYFNDMHRAPQTPQELAVIGRACELFDLHVTDALMALTLRSLIKQYAAARATYVLTSTRMLVDYPHRRMVETLQFVADVMDVDGFTPNGCALRSIQKLRLIHALIRHRINRSRTNAFTDESAVAFTWDDSWGHPINQADMIFAVHTFSVEVIDGLLSYGVRLKQQQIEDYYLAWHYYGRALGVKDELNPKTYAEGKALQERIYAIEFAPNPNALTLTPPLIEFTKALLPFSPNETHIFALAKRYNDPKDYRPVFEDILAIPIMKAHIGWLWWYFALDHVIHIIQWIRLNVFTIVRSKERKTHYLAHRNQRLIQAIVNLEKTWTGKHFRINDGFGKSAGMADAHELETQPSFFERFSHMMGRTF